MRISSGGEEFSSSDSVSLKEGFVETGLVKRGRKFGVSEYGGYDFIDLFEFFKKNRGVTAVAMFEATAAMSYVQSYKGQLCVCGLLCSKNINQLEMVFP